MKEKSTYQPDTNVVARIANSQASQLNVQSKVTRKKS